MGFANCSADDALEPGQGKVLGNVENLLDHCGLQLFPAPRREPGQLADTVIRQDRIPGAMCVVRAFVGLEAMVARRDVRRGGPGQHALQFRYLRGHRVEKFMRLVIDRTKLEQRVEIKRYAVVYVIPVECEDRCIAYVQPGTLQHP